jgi:hypothetical protein
MNRNQIAVGVLALVVTAIIGLVLFASKTHSFTLTTSQIQKEIDSRLPITKNDITAKAVKVDLSDGSIRLHIEAEGQKFGQSFAVSANTTCTLKFETDTGKFFLEPQDIKASDLKVNGKDISEKVSGALEELGKKTEIKTERKFFGNTIELKLNGKNLSEKADALLGKFIDSAVDKKKLIGDKIESSVLGALEKSAKIALRNLPVYKLPDDFKGNTARMAIESIEISNDSATVHLSLGQLIGSLIGWIVMTLIGLSVLFSVAMFSN